MKKRIFNSRFLHRAVLAAMVAATMAVACAKNNPVSTGPPLCGGDSGLGARIIGRSDPIDVCISDKDTSVLITTGDHYTVTASRVTTDVTFEFTVVFPVIGDQAPQILNLHDDLGAALADPMGVYLYYQEVPKSGDPIESVQITDGSFTLSFSTFDLLTATMSGVTMKMKTVSSSPQDAGTRTIEKGFMSLGVDG